MNIQLKIASSYPPENKIFTIGSLRIVKEDQIITSLCYGSLGTLTFETKQLFLNSPGILTASKVFLVASEKLWLGCNYDQLDLSPLRIFALEEIQIRAPHVIVGRIEFLGVTKILIDCEKLSFMHTPDQVTLRAFRQFAKNPNMEMDIPHRTREEIQKEQIEIYSKPNS